jgi:branched-chain amino acid transport system substrate-binding protein
MCRFRTGAVVFGSRLALLLFFILTIATSSSLAQTPGVTDNSILIGSCSALDGPTHFLGQQTVMGATVYLHAINDEGGIFGRKIQLLAFDDSYDPEKAPACFKRMTKEGVFALGFFVGTPTAKVYVPMAQEEKIPVVGLFTGAQMLYETSQALRNQRARELLRRDQRASRQIVGERHPQNRRAVPG